MDPRRVAENICLNMFTRLRHIDCICCLEAYTFVRKHLHGQCMHTPAELVDAGQDLQLCG